MDYHVRYTHPLHKFDPKRFSIAMPKKVTSTYLLIFDLIDDAAPSSKHIISDTYDVRTSIKYIAEPKGCTIPDVKNVKNSRKGRQREVWGCEETNHVLNRVRMLAEDDYGENSKKKMHKDSMWRKVNAARVITDFFKLF